MTKDKSKIKSEAEDHITIGMLLRKKRNWELEKKVEKIMHSKLSITEKIKEITEIDESEKKASVEQEKRPVKQYELKSEDESIKKRIVWNRRRIKAFPSQSSFFHYLFREYRNIRDFGEKTHIFSSRLLLPGFRLNKNVGKSFMKYLQPWSHELLKILDKILKTGWLYLYKADYNLLVILKKLCEKINSTNFNHLNYKDRNLIDRLRSLENLFLFLHYHEEYPETILYSFQTIFNKDPNYEEDPRNVIGLGRRILFKDAALPSLCNFLLGLNMYKYKRYFRLQDLIQSNLREVISCINFDCSPDVQNEIDICIKESSKNLIPFHKQKLEIMRMKSFLSVDNSGEIDFSSLQFFYESTQSKNRYNFRKDKEDIILIISRFLRMFESSFKYILNGKIHISGVGKVEIFSQNFFHMEFSRTQYLIEKLDKLSFGFPSSFSWKRYLLLNRSNKGATHAEAEVMQLINEGLSFLREIADKLSRVLSLRQPAENKEKEPDPIEKIALKGKPFSLPYEDKKVKSTADLGGKSIAENLSFIVSICFLACVFFQDKYTVSLLGKEKRVNDEMRLKLELLERIANPDVFEKIREMYS